MFFNSLAFAIFFPVVFLLYWLAGRYAHRAQNVLLVIASYFFYGWWSYQFLGLLVLSTFLDYVYGFSVASTNRKKAKLFLWLGILNNLGILAVFKYYNFFAVQVQEGFASLGLHTNPVLLDIALPVGISFYTFHGMSYVIDIYRGKQKPVRQFVDYAVFVAFFPLLVAGPIERAGHLLPQVQTPRLFRYHQAVAGCKLVLWGIFKKVVIADNLAVSVNNIFSNFETMDPLSLFLGAVAFAFQIYGDFSGYSDIALGTAKLLGFELLSNFRFPYFSRNLGEFWRRWHISLSSWFRDYLYIPLGGSRNGRWQTVRNTFIIFLVSGFWHGANWTFIAWGFLHACGFLPLLLKKDKAKERSSTGVVAEHRSLPSWQELWQMLSTFLFVTLAWIFFRAENLSQAFKYLERMTWGLFDRGNPLTGSMRQYLFIIYILPLLVADWYLRRDERLLRVPFAARPLRWLFYAFLIFLIGMFMQINKSAFIYFQF